MVARVLENAGATVRSRGEIYKAVEKSVLLYSSKRFLVTGEMLKVLTRFHKWAARYITGMTDKRGAGGDWYYPLVNEAMESAGLQPIGVYIKRRQTTIADRVACLPFYALCM